MMLSNKFIQSLLIVGIFFSLSCTQNISNQSISAVPDNLYSVTTSSGAQLILKKTLGPDSSSNADFVYYNVLLTPANVPGDKHSKEFEFFINHDIQNSFSFVYQGDTLHPVMCQRIPSIQKNSFEYEVVFEKYKNRPFLFVFEDDQYGMGKTLISIKAKDF